MKATQFVQCAAALRTSQLLTQTCRENSTCLHIMCACPTTTGQLTCSQKSPHPPGIRDRECSAWDSTMHVSPLLSVLLRCVLLLLPVGGVSNAAIACVLTDITGTYSHTA